MIGHELRTPMNGVLGLAQTLSTSDLDDRQAEHVAMLVQSGNSLMTILNDLLDISKIEAGKLDIEEAAFDLHLLAQQVHSLLTHTSKNSVLITLDIAADTPRWLMGDPARIRQIMQNLTSNALKFTIEGEVCLALRSCATTVEGQVGFEILVRDTGIGLSEEQQGRLFQPFSQASASTARQYGGTGLGLSICRRLSELMGGQISVQSTPGKGSTFRVALQLAPAQPIVAVEHVEASDTLTAVRVLVADDHPTNRAVAKAILEALGCVVETVEDGERALTRLVEQNFDVVLMDIHMPGMGGVAAMQQIRAGRAGAADLPVIALTADVVPSHRGSLESLGFNAVQPKPIDMATLASTIHDAVAARRGDADGLLAAAISTRASSLLVHAESALGSKHI
jgi:CheY-like chemotaxis protein